MNENPQVWVSAKRGTMGFGSGEVDENLEKVFIDVSVDGIYNILVIGTRKDKIAREHFDEKGVEYEVV